MVVQIIKVNLHVMVLERKIHGLCSFEPDVDAVRNFGHIYVHSDNLSKHYQFYILVQLLINICLLDYCFLISH